MFNKEKHRAIMGKILRDIYSDTSIASLIGFKGGTCAYMFYGLTRFSIDLDFDLLSQEEATQRLVYDKIKNLLGRYGEMKDQYIKRNTIFFLLSYGPADHNIKIEIHIRALMPNMRNYYEIKEYLGISMLIGKKEYLFACKLAALTDRNRLAMRDIYDVWFFTKNIWDIDSEVLKTRTGKTIKEHLNDCISIIEAVKSTQILHGLAELLPGEKEKAWVKNNLKSETIFALKNYQSVLT